MTSQIKDFLFQETLSSAQTSASFLGTINNMQAIIILTRKLITPTLLEQLVLGDSTVYQQNDCYSSAMCTLNDEVSVRIICPATNEHVEKFRSKKHCYVEEKESEYVEFRKQLGDIKNNWIKNVIEEVDNVKEEAAATKETILYNDKEFVIMPDYKWDQKNVSNAYLLLLFKQKELYTLRDVDDHMILQRAKEAISKTLPIYNLTMKDVIIFFHYHPSYYTLHLHIVNVGCMYPSMGIGRAVLLDDVIYNLEKDALYYKKKTMYFVRPEKGLNLIK